MQEKGFVDEEGQPNFEYYQQGPFRIHDNFTIILLNIRSNTKVTTLNRINSVKTLLFMGNGNGIISHAKGRGYTAG
jgi:ribosomal protein S5